MCLFGDAIPRIQSAMEYLMTYGWAILIIAVVLGALYQLGIFNSNGLSLSSSCLASAGFLCQTPMLNTSGSLAVKFGQIGLGTITVTNVACTTNVTSPTSTQSANAVLGSGQTSILTFSCPLSSNAIGTPFKGYIWITYNTQTQSGVVDRIAVVTSKISTSGSSAAALGGTAGNGVINVYVYCVGGQMAGGGRTNLVYYAPVSAGGIGSWTSTSSYPIALQDPACTTSGGYIYCVGGYDGTSGRNAVYYAPLLAPGVGTWTSTNVYPTTIYQTACSISGGYVYCTAGYTGAAVVNSVYYAPVSSGGVGSWSSTTAYPISLYGESCTIGSGNIYCAAGNTGASVTNAYYASVSSGGVGIWSTTTSYPISLYQEKCTNSGGYIYCGTGLTGGGAVQSAFYYSPISGSGISAWGATNSYPLALGSSTCTVSGGYEFCVGGDTGVPVSNAYYASISSGGIGTWASTNSYPVAVKYASCQVG